MAQLQRSIATNSFWIGIGKEPYIYPIWQQYTQSNTSPFAIYSESNPQLWYNYQASSLYMPYSTSFKSNDYVSGFAGSGFNISAIPKTVDGITKYFWTGEFDDLNIRGSMHVKEYVIDQIRATNGSLWVSDAAKAISASFVPAGNDNTGTMSLYFESGSMIPFTNGDIIRSKRWIPSGSTVVSNWDFLGIVSNIALSGTNYVVTMTGSKSGVNFNNYYLDGQYATWKAFVSAISTLQSQWVRVGNTSSATNRTSSIYLTANDAGGPFLDMIDGVTSITDALGGSSTTVSATSSKIKLRLGKLTGITDASLGGSLNGYGLYADNAYLKGKIVANSGGTISNWIIGPDELYSNNIHLHTDGTNGYLSVGTSTYNTNGIWIGVDTNPKLSIKNGNQYILFDGTNISIQTPNFTASGGNVYLTGTITASAGAIANWNIGTDKLYSGNVTLSSQNNNQYLGIGSNAYGNNGIYIGFSNSLNRLSLVNNLNKFLWDGTQLGISSSNFTLSQGKITATAGTIANWGIDTNKLTSSATSASIELRTSPSSAWNIVGTNGYVFGNTQSQLVQIIRNYFTSSGDTFNPFYVIPGTSSWVKSDINDFVLKFTSSHSGSAEQTTSDYVLTTWKTQDQYRITANAGETIYIGINGIAIEPAFVQSDYFDTLYLTLQTNSMKKSDLLLFNSATNYSRSNIFMSYTNTSAVGETYSLNLKVKNKRPATYPIGTPPQEIFYFTISGLNTAKAKGYAELNPSGLLVYAGPTNYLKITTEPAQGGGTFNTAVASFDTLIVKNLIGAQIASAGGGIQGGIDGTGTPGYIPIWNATTTLGNSALQYSNNAFSSSVPFSISEVALGTINQYNLLIGTANKGIGNLGTGNSGQYLKSNGASSNPSWTSPAALSVTNDTNVTISLSGNPTTALLNSIAMALQWNGQLSVGRGGTGRSGIESNSIIVGNGSSSFTAIAPGSLGQILIGQGANIPIWSQNLWLDGDIQTTGIASIGTNFTVSGTSSFNNDVYMYQDLRLYNETNPSIFSKIYYKDTYFNIILKNSTDTIQSNGNMNIQGSQIQFGQNTTDIVHVYGTLQCNALKEYSLRQYKHSIQQITQSQLQNIMHLRPITFLYKGQNPENVSDPKIRQAGFLAEQVQNIYPEVAWYKDGKLAGLQYQRLTAYLTKGIQQLNLKLEQKDKQLNIKLEQKDKQINELRNEVSELRNELKSIVLNNGKSQKKILCD